MRLDEPSVGIDVDGPVQIEVFVLAVLEDAIHLTGPCGAGAWHVEAGGDHPVDVVRRVSQASFGEPLLVHSTSWRQARDGVILTFFVAIAPEQVGSMATRLVPRERLARSGATAAPAVISTDQVLEHAIRHLAWLARDDDVVRDRLSDDWRRALVAYQPEPFKNLG